MKTKLIIFLLTLLAAFYVTTIYPAMASADEGTRQKLVKLSQQVAKEDARQEAIRAYRARVERVRNILAGANSPMEPEAESFIACGEQYGVSWKLLLGLAWKESSYGKHTPHYGRPSHNAFGWTGSGIPSERFRTFASWGDGVCHVAEGLARNYNHTNIRETIYKYAPPVENDSERYVAQLNNFINDL